MFIFFVDISGHVRDLCLVRCLHYEIFVCGHCTILSAVVFEQMLPSMNRPLAQQMATTLVGHSTTAPSPGWFL